VNALQLEAASRHAGFPLLHDAHRKFEVAEPIHCGIIAFLLTLLYAVTLTFDLWPWTFAVYRLCGVETLYQIWTQSSNLWRSYCDFIIWPNDLEHVLGPTCCARLWDNVHQVWPSITYPYLNYSVLNACRLFFFSS